MWIEIFNATILESLMDNRSVYKSALTVAKLIVGNMFWNVEAINFKCFPSPVKLFCMIRGAWWNDSSSTNCLRIHAITSLANVNWWTLNVNVGPRGSRATLNDNWFFVLLNTHICDTWNTPDKLTKSLILLFFRSFNADAVNGSIIRRKSLVRSDMYKQGKPRCRTNECGAVTTSLGSISSAVLFLRKPRPFFLPILIIKNVFALLLTRIDSNWWKQRAREIKCQVTAKKTVLSTYVAHEFVVEIFVAIN